MAWRALPLETFTEVGESLRLEPNSRVEFLTTISEQTDHRFKFALTRRG
jgi:hypothetical protein